MPLDRVPCFSKPRGRSCPVAACIVTMLVLAMPSSTAAAADWNDALSAYARNPFRNRRALLTLRREDPDTLPALHLLALGEASLRGRRYAAARQQFDAALARGLGEPWEGWARVGLAWIALAREAYPEARRQFAVVAASPTSPSAGLARYGVALLDAAAEQPGTAVAFEAVAADAQAAPDLRRAARLGLAYAFYWQEAYARAAEAFDAVAADGEVGMLWDDARYGAAWARLRAGERDAAAAALAHLATGDPRRGRAAPRALVNLEPQAILRAGFERYRRGPLDAPEAHLARVLDGDGSALAAAALRGLETDPERMPRAPLTHVRARLSNEQTGDAAARAPERPSKPTANRRRTPATTDDLALAGAAAILFLAFALWWWVVTRR